MVFASNVWPPEGTEMGALVRHLDWSKTALGPMSDWPPSLRIAVTMALDSPLPTIVLWGPDLIQIYNDAYRPILGLRHPAAFGQRTRDCWPEVWDFNAVLYNRVLSTGERVHLEDQEYVIAPSGISETRYFTVIYAPTRDEAGDVRGVFVIVAETTRRVLAERENITLLKATQFAAGQLQHMFDHAPSFMALLKGPEYVFNIVNAAFMRLFSRYDVLEKTVGQAVPEFESQGLVKLLDQVFASGEPFLAYEMSVYLRDSVDGRIKEYHLDFVFQPIKDHNGDVSAIFVDGSDKTEQRHARLELRRLNQKLTDKVVCLEEAQTELFQSRSTLRKLIDHQESIKEDERKRIARDIHDDLGAVLTGIKANVSVSIDRSARGGLPEDPLLIEAVEQADAAIGAVRRVITELRPSVLDQLGVWAALEWYAGIIEERTGLQCQWSISESAAGVDLDSDRSTMLFRIVQEALTNVVRHAGAKQVKIRIFHYKRTIIVKIKDDGKGIGKQQLRDGKSWGILGMHERTRHFGGELSISGALGAGTAVILRLPLN
ncbi:PAS domain-containing protein [Glaciimonas sp. CA11.2]|uniref:PAS domain-containing sensor histidine kinase n=1 Tax=unclassified Glaciimonas TaxID=2644401 RepID=UPI002AB46E0E|nr:MULTISPECIES: PAS domain-containing protein [unclassified Glaciimonas]MDY7546681.1 PAS domain-containing protein [Glaciimonas sp. CA11.2]MEB0011806.1 PAS domain-containing protein [Glaciimonas sp. Cout2]MEB0080638.1 PAS domain-containing protein [Glaciimonas sp. Gout2]MEB0162262.1 PAS domain-containing protein [Glaciimonas sp. CA11.2]